MVFLIWFFRLTRLIRLWTRFLSDQLIYCMQTEIWQKTLVLRTPAYDLLLSKTKTHVSSSFAYSSKGQIPGFSIERHREHWLCLKTTSSGKILTLVCLTIVAMLQNFVTFHQKGQLFKAQNTNYMKFRSPGPPPPPPLI